MMTRMEPPVPSSTYVSEEKDEDLVNFVLQQIRILLSSSLTFNDREDDVNHWHISDVSLQHIRTFLNPRHYMNVLDYKGDDNDKERMRRNHYCLTLISRRVSNDELQIRICKDDTDLDTYISPSYPHTDTDACSIDNMSSSCSLSSTIVLFIRKTSSCTCSVLNSMVAFQSNVIKLVMSIEPSSLSAVTNIIRNILQINHTTTTREDGARSTSRVFYDEIRYWEEQLGYTAAKSTNVTEMINRILNGLYRITDELCRVTALEGAHAADRVDILERHSLINSLGVLYREGGVLDDALRQIYNVNIHLDKIFYPRERMKNVIDALSRELCNVLWKCLPIFPNICVGSFTSIRSSLLMATNVVEQFDAMIRNLSIDLSSPSKFKGTFPILNMNECTHCFLETLKSILRIRATVWEIEQLVPDSQRMIELVNSPDFIVESVEYSEINHDQLISTGTSFNRYFEHMESQAANEFLRIFTLPFATSSLTFVLQAMEKMKKFSNLLKRDLFSRMVEPVINAIREKLFLIANSFEDFIDNIDFDGDIPKLIIECRYCQSSTCTILDMISGFVMGTLHEQFKIIGSKSTNTESQLYQHWVRSFTSDFAIPKLPYTITIEHSMVSVCIEKNLGLQLRQARKLIELGFSIPSSIETKLYDARKCHHYGTILKKVAISYNSIITKTPPNQKSFVRYKISQMENFLMNGMDSRIKGEKFRAVSDEERFIGVLQSKVESLKIECNTISNYHSQVIQHTEHLSSLKLSNTGARKKCLKDILSIFNSVLRKYGREISLPWLLDWSSKIDILSRKLCENEINSIFSGNTKVDVALDVQGSTVLFQPNLSELCKTLTKELTDIVKPINIQIGTNICELIEMESETYLRKFNDAWNILGNEVYELLGSRQDLISRFHELRSSIDLNNRNALENWMQKLSQWEKNLLFIRDVERIRFVNVNNVVFKTFLMKELDMLVQTEVLKCFKQVHSNLKHIESFLRLSIFDLSQPTKSIRDVLRIQLLRREVKGKIPQMYERLIECEGLFDTIKLMDIKLPDDTRMNIEELLMMFRSTSTSEPTWTSLENAIRTTCQNSTDNNEFEEMLKNETELCLARVELLRNQWLQMRPANLLTSSCQDVTNIMGLIKNLESGVQVLHNDVKNIQDMCSFLRIDSYPELESCFELKNDFDGLYDIWSEVQRFTDELNYLRGKCWVEIRLQFNILREFVDMWLERLRSISDKNAVIAPVLVDVIEWLILLSNSLPALCLCVGKNFKEDHWFEIIQGRLLLATDIELNNLTLGHLFDKLSMIVSSDFLFFLQSLEIRAIGEVKIREGLKEFEVWSRNCEIKVKEYKTDKENVPLITDWAELLGQISEKQSLLITLKGSKCFEPFLDIGNVYISKLSVLDHIVQHLRKIQSTWLYLIPIFESGAIIHLNDLFLPIDQTFRCLMKIFKGNMLLFHLVDNQSKILSDQNLLTLRERLEICEKSLCSYLEDTRMMIPRFYFLSDYDLMEIIGRADDTYIILKHIHKVFQAIKTINTDNGVILGFGSGSENILLLERIKLTRTITGWFQALVDGQKKSLEKLLLSHNQRAAVSTNDKVPVQIVLLNNEVKFCKEVEHELSGTRDFKSLFNRVMSQLTSLVSSLDANKSDNLMLSLIRHRDIADCLVTSKVKVSDISDWLWQKHLRYYLNTPRDSFSSSCIVRMGLANMSYSYEYQGAYTGLVYTSLTDRCFLALTQAIHFGLGGNPYGQAGTGKTESVKALGAALGRHVLVFNCDEKLNSIAMGRIFIGLVKSGAWGCFDEFNRLSIDQISIISDQIRAIQIALKNKAFTLTLIGRNVEIDLNSALFITLNPAGDDYKGRAHLPENLKLLFRPICMGKPDTLKVIEVLLLIKGFSNYLSLARKLLLLFESLQFSLSPQKHYIWGLRTFISVVKIAGKLRSKSNSSNDEEDVLSQAVCRYCLPSILASDIDCFMTLLSLTFVSKEMLPENMPCLRQDIVTALDTYLIRCYDREKLISKAIQLKILLDQKMGCAIIGDPFSGKSTIWKLLKSALELNGKEHVHVFVLNPKALPRKKLLGYLDNETNEWFDGILVKGIRQVLDRDSGRSWIICDGDIDPEWIEDLNSVLDDNRILTLPNGERITIPTCVNFIFESHNLSYASPASISRLGILFTPVSTASVEEVTSHLIYHKYRDCHPDFEIWTARHVSFALNIFGRMALNSINILKYLIENLQQCKNEKEFAIKLTEELEHRISPRMRDHYRSSMSTWLHEQVLHQASQEKIEVDSQHNIFSGNPLISYKNVIAIKSFIFNPDPFLMIGSNGSRKEATLRTCLQKVNDSVCIVSMQCSKDSSSLDVIHHIEANCNLIRLNGYLIAKPQDVGRLFLLVKDIHVLAFDEYGSNSLISLLHQIISHHGYYNEELHFVKVECVKFIMLCDRFDQYIRYSRLDGITNVMYFYRSEENINNLCKFYLSHFASHVHYPQMCAFVADLFSSLKTYDNFQFTTNDFVAWMTSLSQYNHQCSDLIECILYEASYHFQASLLEEHDISLFNSVLDGVLKKYWPEHDARSNLYRLNYIRQSVVNSPTSLNTEIQLIQLDTLKDKFDRKLESYRYDCKVAANLVLSTNTCVSLSMIELALMKEDGHCLLVGKRGVGKRVLTKFLSHCNCFEWIEAKISRNDTSIFKLQLKEILKISGIDDKYVCVHVPEYVATQPRVLHLISSVISNGYDPSLFTSTDDLANFLSPLDEDGICTSQKLSTIRKFTARIKRNVHFCLSFDKCSPLIKEINKFYPSIQEKMKVLLLADPNVNALMEICSKVFYPKLFSMKCDIMNITSMDDTTENTDDESSNRSMITDAVNIHGDASNSLNAPPVDFFTLLSVCKSMYLAKKNTCLKDLLKVENGMKKVKETRILVKTLQEDSISHENRLIESQKDADNAMDTIASALSRAKKSKDSSNILKAVFDKKTADASARKLKIKRLLDEVQPTLDRARDSVCSINNSDLHEIRSLKSPPSVISDLLGAVLILLGQRDLSWEAMKRFLNSKGVKRDILKFDPSCIEPRTVEYLEKFIRNREKSFDPMNVKRATSAGLPLLNWVHACVSFAQVYPTIRPLQEELLLVERDLHSNEKDLKICLQELDEVEEYIARLKEDFGFKNNETMKRKENLTSLRCCLSRAESLVTLLEDEMMRWNGMIAKMRKNALILPSMTLLASAYITYLMNIGKERRSRKTQQWVKCLGLQSFHFMDFIGSQKTLLTWKEWSLPGDDKSIENAIGISYTLKKAIPYINDPTGECQLWLRKYLKDADAPSEFVSISDQTFQTKAELSVKYGKILVVTELTSIPCWLCPLLDTNAETIFVGGMTINRDDNYSCVLIGCDTTTTMNQRFVKTFDFSIDCEKIRSQLLNFIVSFENPELESRRLDASIKKENHQLDLLRLEFSLLSELDEIGNEILSNDNVIDTLKKTKYTYDEVQAALKIIDETSIDLEREREIYDPLALLASRIYDVTEHLWKLDSTYYVNSNSFFRILGNVLQSSQLNMRATNDRIVNLRLSLITEFLFEVGQFMQEHHTTVFALLLVKIAFPGQFGNEDEWHLFMNIFNANDIIYQADTSWYPSWLPVELQAVVEMVKDFCPRLVQDINTKSDLWKDWFQQDAPESNFTVSNDFSRFQQLLIIQAFRPDRFIEAIKRFCCLELSIPSLTKAQSLANIYGSRTDCISFLLIMTPGADPMHELEQLADSVVGLNRFITISIGGYSIEKILSILQNSIAEGTWLCLKNLHLNVQIDAEIRHILGSSNNFHKDFRLWLVTEQSQSLPRPLLKESAKIIFRVPDGIIPNMHRCLNLSVDHFTKNDPLRSRMTFLIALLHSFILERNRYNGWSETYDFSTNDFFSAASASQFVSCENFPAIHSLVMNYSHGLRLNDEYDQSILKLYIDRLFSKSVINGKVDLPIQSSKDCRFPKATDLNSLQSFLENLDIDIFTTLGLNRNSGIDLQTKSSHMFISNLTRLTEGMFENEMCSKANSSLNDALFEIVSFWEGERDDIAFKFDKCGEYAVNSDDLVKSFFFMEFYSGRFVFSKIRETMDHIRSLIAREDFHTPIMYEVIDDIINDRTPQIFLQLWVGPRQFKKWLVGAAKRIKASLKCLDSQQSSHLVVNLNDFFHCGSLFHLLRQSIARDMNISFDSLQLVCLYEIEGFRFKHAKTLVLKDLHLQGCSYDGKYIRAGKVRSLMPPLKVSYVRSSEITHDPTCPCFQLPLYSDESRFQLLCTLRLPCQSLQEAENCLLANAACFVD